MSYIEHQGGKVHETNACAIVYQVLQAVKHLHNLNIVHRDIKSENILMSSPTVGARVILTDFGGSTRAESSKFSRMLTQCGTLDFVAPSVFTAHDYLVTCG